MRNLILPALLLALGCGGSPSSGGVTHDYVFNTVDGQFHDNTLVDGELTASNIISDAQYDEQSHSQLLSSDMRFHAECVGSCQPAPGDYTLEYAIISDSCELGALPAQLVSIGADGLNANSMPSAPDGCVDEVQSAGLTASVRRHCEMMAAGHADQVNQQRVSSPIGAEVRERMLRIDVKDVIVHLDFAQRSGTASVLKYVPGEGTGNWCFSSQRVKIEKWN